MLTVILGAACAFFGGIIVIVHLVMYVGLTIARLKLRKSPSPDGPPLRATVLVPARDEEELLPRLLSSLDGQTVTDFSVVLVNDRSKDSTARIMEDYAERNPGRVTIVTVDKDPEISNGKLNAMIKGSTTVEGDLVFFTDADCIVPKTWVEDLIGAFRNPRLGIFLGPIETRRTGTLLASFHAFDHIFKYGYTAGCTGIEMPTGGFGNNLGIRKKALDEIGGFESLEVTATEDAALIAAVRQKTDWRTRAFFSRRVTVQTEPQRTWKQLTRQEVRWHTGAIFSPDLNTSLSYSFIMIYLLVSVLAIPVSPFLPIVGILPAVSFTTMSLMAVASGALTRQPVIQYWLVLVPFILLSMVYNSFLTFTALLKPTLIWKGDRLTGL